MSRRIHEVAFVWLSNVTDAWFYARERGDYYPMCRGKKRHRGGCDAQGRREGTWAPPKWNLRWHYKSHSVRGQGTSHHYCDACLPDKWRRAARSLEVAGDRAIRLTADGDYADWGAQFICPKHGRRDNDTVTTMKTCAVAVRRGLCDELLKRT